MPLDLSCFSQVQTSDISKMSTEVVEVNELEDQLITSSSSFKGKVISTLSYIPVLKDLAAVQHHLEQVKLKNVKTVTLFLKALEQRIGEDARKIIEQSPLIDLSGAKPLTKRQVTILVQLGEQHKGVCALKNAITEASKIKSIEEQTLLPNPPNETSLVEIITNPKGQSKKGLRYYRTFYQQLVAFKHKPIPQPLEYNSGFFGEILGISSAKLDTAVLNAIEKYNHNLELANLEKRRNASAQALAPSSDIKQGKSTLHSFSNHVQSTAKALQLAIKMIKKQHASEIEQIKKIKLEQIDNLEQFTPIQKLYLKAKQELATFKEFGETANKLSELYFNSRTIQLNTFYNQLPDTTKKHITTKQLCHCFDIFLPSSPNKLSRESLLEGLSSAIYHNVDLPEPSILIDVIINIYTKKNMGDSSEKLKVYAQTQAAIDLFIEASQWAKNCQTQDLKRVGPLTQKFTELLTVKKSQFLQYKDTNHLLLQLDPSVVDVKLGKKGRAIIKSASPNIRKAVNEFRSAEKKLHQTKTLIQIRMDQSESLNGNQLVTIFQTAPKRHIEETQKIVELNEHYITKLDYLIRQLSERAQDKWSLIDCR